MWPSYTFIAMLSCFRSRHVEGLYHLARKRLDSLSVCPALLFSLAKHLWSVKPREKQNTSRPPSHSRLNDLGCGSINEWDLCLASGRHEQENHNLCLEIEWKEEIVETRHPGTDIGLASDVPLTISFHLNHLLCSLLYCLRGACCGQSLKLNNLKRV